MSDPSAATISARHAFERPIAAGGELAFLVSARFETSHASRHELGVQLFLGGPIGDGDAHAVDVEVDANDAPLLEFDGTLDSGDTAGRRTLHAEVPRACDDDGCSSVQGVTVLARRIDALPDELRLFVALEGTATYLVEEPAGDDAITFVELRPPP